jgi:putative transposase
MPPKEIDIRDELIDQLLAGREGPEEITGPDRLLKQLTKRVVERAMSAELTGHLGEDILVFSVDGLKGFPEAIYPDAIVQTRHMIRNSLRFTSYKDRKLLVKDSETALRSSPDWGESAALRERRCSRPRMIPQAPDSGDPASSCTEQWCEGLSRVTKPGAWHGG